MKKICVVGLGYVGLPTSLILAKCGYQVLGVDISREKIKLLKSGTCSIADAAELFSDSKVKKNFTSDLKPSKSNVFIIAVPTPLKSKEKKADLSYVKKAITSICPYLRTGNLVILESTVPPGTCRNIILPIIERKTKYKINQEILLAHCPERAIPTNTINEIINNDRIIGGINKTAALRAAEIYSNFVQGKLHLTDDRTAEMVKLVENAFRDVNIAFANEIENVCQSLGILATEVIRLANYHPRVNVHLPGIGVGGHCIPIDPLFISETFPNKTKIIKMARTINDKKPYLVTKKIVCELKGQKQPKIVVAGISYKKNVNDTRESPALKIIEQLKEYGIKVSIYDPIVYPSQRGKLLSFCEQKDALVVLVQHDIIMKELGDLKNKILSKMNKQKVLIY